MQLRLRCTRVPVQQNSESEHPHQSISPQSGTTGICFLGGIFRAGQNATKRYKKQVSASCGFEAVISLASRGPHL